MKEPNEAKKQIHQHFRFQEECNMEGSECCTVCGEEVMLICAPSTWVVDREAFKSGESTRDDDNVPDEVEIGEEITAHWCNKCGVITSLSFNSF